MSYTSKVPLLQDTYDSLQESINEDIRLRFRHSDSIGGFWPSSASIKYTIVEDGEIVEKVEGTCLRQAYYKTKNIEPTEKESPRGLKVTSLGTNAEDIFREWFHGTPNYRVIYPDQRGKKLRFSNKSTKIRGEVDLIMEHKDSNGNITRFGIDIKTYDGPDAALDLAGYKEAKKAYRSNMRYIRKGDPRKTKNPFPKIPNLLQAMLYIEEFERTGITLWQLVYIARDKGPDAFFDIELEDHLGERVAKVNGVLYPEFTLRGIYERFAELEKYINSNTLPPKDYIPEYDSDKILQDPKYPKWMKEKVKGKLPDDDDPIVRDWQCRFCPYLTKCLNENSDHSIF